MSNMNEIEVRFRKGSKFTITLDEIASVPASLREQFLATKIREELSKLTTITYDVWPVNFDSMSIPESPAKEKVILERGD
jgi:hypothetical protein